MTRLSLPKSLTTPRVPTTPALEWRAPAHPPPWTGRRIGRERGTEQTEPGAGNWNWVWFDIMASWSDLQQTSKLSSAPRPLPHPPHLLPVPNLATTSLFDMDPSVPPRYYRPLVPLQDSPPTLPSPGPIPARPVALPRTAPFGADFASRTGQEWLVETYVYPAAHPRSLLGATKSRRSDDDGLDLADSPRAGTPPPPAPPTRLSKEEIAKKLGDLMQARTQAMRDSDRHDFERDFQDRNPLWIAANRYYRASSGRARRPAATPASAAGQQGITLVVAHANGFSKEVGGIAYRVCISARSSSAQHFPCSFILPFNDKTSTDLGAHVCQPHRWRRSRRTRGTHRRDLVARHGQPG